MSTLVANLSIVALALTSNCAAGDTVAATAKANFSAVAMTSHAGIAELGTAWKRAAIRYRTARAQCELLAAPEKNICTAEAKSEQRRARTAARVTYQGGIASSAKLVRTHAETLRGVDIGPDVVLYRAHRQMLDPRSACFATGDSDLSVGKDRT